MNRELLKTTIKDRGFLQQYIAKQLGMSRAGLSKKLNGKSTFCIEEVAILKKVLSLNEDELEAIFFTD